MLQLLCDQPHKLSGQRRINSKPENQKEGTDAPTACFRTSSFINSFPGCLVSKFNYLLLS